MRTLERNYSRVVPNARRWEILTLSPLFAAAPRLRLLGHRNHKNDREAVLRLGKLFRLLIETYEAVLMCCGVRWI